MKIAFAFGRMNPMHIGHESIVDHMAKKGDIALLYLSHKQHPNTDPLDYETKIKWAEKSFGHEADVVRSDRRNLFEALTEIYDTYGGDNEILFVSGSDRSDEMVRAESYNGKESRHGYYKFNSFTPCVIKRDINEDDVQVETAKGEKQREFAANNDLKSFKEYCPSHLTDDEREELFRDVRHGMGLVEELSELDDKLFDELKINMNIVLDENLLKESNNEMFGDAGSITINDKKFLLKHDSNTRFFMKAGEYRFPTELKKIFDGTSFVFDDLAYSKPAEVTEYVVKDSHHGILNFKANNKNITVEAVDGSILGGRGKNLEKRLSTNGDSLNEEMVEAFKKIGINLISDSLIIKDSRGTFDWKAIFNEDKKRSYLDVTDLEGVDDKGNTIYISVKDGKTPSLCNKSLSTKTAEDILSPFVNLDTSSKKGQAWIVGAKAVLNSLLTGSHYEFDKDIYLTGNDLKSTINADAISKYFKNVTGDDSYYMVHRIDSNIDVGKNITGVFKNLDYARVTSTTIYIQFVGSYLGSTNFSFNIRSRTGVGGKPTSELRMNTNVKMK